MYARHYLSGLLRMEGNRHDSGIAREAGVEEQNLQHFMSHSPWSAEAVYRQVQEEVKARPGTDERRRGSGRRKRRGEGQ